MNGVSLSITARCLAADCPWMPTGETWLAIDRETEKHTRAMGHATAVTASRYPVATTEDAS